MNKSFNRVQTLKSSGNCDKYSKRFLYKNLVGGTATIGRDRKQTQRLCEYCANKPLSAVGTFSAFNNAEKVMEKWLQISPVLRLVKVLGLVAVLSFTIITESRAECRAVKQGLAQECKTLKTDGGTCGTGCSYTYDSATQTVYITATGDNARIAGSAFHGNYYENNQMPAKTFVINGAIAIGENAFLVSSEVISGANGALILTGVGHHAFGDSATLSGTIIIPEEAKFDSLAFHGVTLADNAKIYCGVEDCKQKMIDSCNAFGGEYGDRCLTAVNNMGAKLLAYPDGCMKMGASGCTKCKNENFKLNDGECDRLRWTPAEAAEVLTDDNTNSVTITFKK